MRTLNERQVCMRGHSLIQNLRGAGDEIDRFGMASLRLEKAVSNSLKMAALDLQHFPSQMMLTSQIRRRCNCI